MRIDPFAPLLLIDYAYFCERFGRLPFREFVAMWHAADALMQTARDAGYQPQEVPDLLITSNSSEIEFTPSAIKCTPRLMGFLRLRTGAIRRWRSVKRAKRATCRHDRSNF